LHSLHCNHLAGVNQVGHRCVYAGADINHFLESDI